MARLKLSVAGFDYDRTQAIFNGAVTVEGCGVTALAMSPEEVFNRAFKHEEFDVAEISMSNYMNQVARGVNAYIGIPAFVSRMFRHSSIYIRTDRGIEAPADLKGKVVGVPVYQMTAALWARGILDDQYGVTPADLRWRQGALEAGSELPAMQLSLPDEIELTSIAPEETLSQLLDTGELDALISARAPSCLAGNDKIDRLFPNYRAEEEAYFKQTGLFPIMHMVGIRKTLVETHPWLPASVYGAYVAAKRLCYARQAEVGHLATTLPWPVEAFDEAKRLMGADFWRYGARENAGEIAAMMRYAFEHGTVSRKLSVEELFDRSTLDLPSV